VTLRDRYPLVLAGDRGWRSEQLHARIGQAARAGWLKYPGYVPQEDLPALFAGARGFLLPSLYEGFGLPVLEAMASGIPVLTSNDPTLAEVAQDAALLVEPEDVHAMTESIRVVLEDEALAKRRGQSIARCGRPIFLGDYGTEYRGNLPESLAGGVSAFLEVFPDAPLTVCEDRSRQCDTEQNRTQVECRMARKRGI